MRLHGHRRAHHPTYTPPTQTTSPTPPLVAFPAQCHVLGDDWTVVTNDGSRAAQFEHMVAITEDGCEVLTAGDQSEENPLALAF